MWQRSQVQELLQRGVGIMQTTNDIPLSRKIPRWWWKHPFFRKEKRGAIITISYEVLERAFQLIDCEIKEIAPLFYRDALHLKLKITGPRPSVAGEPISNYRMAEGQDYVTIHPSLEKIFRFDR